MTPKTTAEHGHAQLGPFDGRPLSSIQITVFAICFLIAALDGFDTQAMAFVAPALGPDWGLEHHQLGPIFSASLVGSLIGALLLGPAGDRWGRRPVLIGSMLVFGLTSLVLTQATTVPELMFGRLVTGLGLGGAVPALIALTAEYSPRRRRATLIMLMFSGFSIGAVAGSLLSAWMIPAFGWRSVFLVGGLAPLAALLVVIPFLPESLAHLKTRGADGKAARILAQAGAPVEAAALPLETPHRAHESVRQLFADRRAGGTLLIWATFMLSLLLSYFIISWLPTLMREAGLPVRGALLTSAALNLGAVAGSLVFARMVDRRGPHGVLAAAYLIGGVMVALIGMATGSMGLLIAAVAAAGFFSIGAQLCMAAVVAEYYPERLRGTGIGWSMGIGRIGAVAGPTIAGVLLSFGIERGPLFIIAGVVSVLAATSVWLLGQHGRRA